MSKNKSTLVPKVSSNLVAADGKTYPMEYYNLDMILSVQDFGGKHDNKK